MAYIAKRRLPRSKKLIMQAAWYEPTHHPDLKRVVGHHIVKGFFQAYVLTLSKNEYSVVQETTKKATAHSG